MSCKGTNKPTAEDRSNLDFLVFRGSKLEIVKGVKTKTELDLSDFFIQADSFLSQEFTITAGDQLDLGPGNVTKLDGEVQFLAIVVDYPEDTLPEDKYLFWRYPSISTDQPAPVSPNPILSPEFPDNPVTYTIGRLMILTGSTRDLKGWDLSADKSPTFGGIVLTNPHEEDVKVRVLIVK